MALFSQDPEGEQLRRYYDRSIEVSRLESERARTHSSLGPQNVSRVEALANEVLRATTRPTAVGQVLDEPAATQVRTFVGTMQELGLPHAEVLRAPQPTSGLARFLTHRTTRVVEVAGYPIGRLLSPSTERDDIVPVYVCADGGLRQSVVPAGQMAAKPLVTGIFVREGTSVIPGLIEVNQQPTTTTGELSGESIANFTPMPISAVLLRHQLPDTL